MSKMNIAVAGASGRMGRMLIEAIVADPDATLAGALDIAASPAIGTDAAAFLGKPAGVTIESELAKGLANAQYLIDFTRPEGTLKHLDYCAAHDFVSKEMVAQLREGMTPEQVRFVLCTPLINDAFHAGRWDYPFRIKDGKGNVTSSHVSVFFKDGRVSHFEGGDLPSEKDYLQRIAAPK